VGGKLYVFGGEIPAVFSENEEHDPAARSWRGVADLPTARHGMGAVTVGAEIHLIGGAVCAGLCATGAHEVFRPSAAGVILSSERKRLVLTHTEGDRDRW
jgi:hypothetical protein